MSKPAKRLLSALLVLCLMLSLCACGTKETAKDAENGKKRMIVCSIFPVYDFTRRIAGEKADVYQLLPEGMDTHDYEPTLGDIINCDKADLFIYTDSEMEVWIDALSRGFEHVKLVRCAENIDLEMLNEQWEQIENAHGGEEHEHEHRYDAHVWLDPTLSAVMCDNILKSLTALDPENAEYYNANCLSLKADLAALDERFQALFSAHPDAVLFFGGKFSYSHFIRHYGVKYLSAYDGCSENAEVNHLELIELIAQMKLSGAKVVFTDELSNGEIAEEIARETGAEVLVFHSCHNVSREEKKLSFIDLMNRNYDNISRALDGR